SAPAGLLATLRGLRLVLSDGCRRADQRGHDKQCGEEVLHLVCSLYFGATNFAAIRRGARPYAIHAVQRPWPSDPASRCCRPASASPGESDAPAPGTARASKTAWTNPASWPAAVDGSDGFDPSAARSSSDLYTLRRDDDGADGRWQRRIKLRWRVS